MLITLFKIDLQSRHVSLNLDEITKNYAYIVSVVYVWE